MSRSLIIRNIRISDLHSPFHAQQCDVRVEEGVIAEISPRISASAPQEIEGQDAWLSPGWVDSFVRIPDPGEPWKESLESASLAAQESGFTHMVALCGRKPQSDVPETISTVLERSKGLACQILPLALCSEAGEGKELSEMHLLKQAGAHAFCDGIHSSPLLSARLKTMQYAHSLNASVWSHPSMAGWVGEAKMHEGNVNAGLGLKGIPSMAEFVELRADLELVRYTGAPLRVLAVSCKESVALIREAKAEGLPIWASVPVLNLIETDAALEGFDECFKVLPPLRGEDDRAALWEGLSDGTIDAIVSNHHPEDAESSLVEFDYSPYGSATLPMFWPALVQANTYMDTDQLVECLHRGSRNFCGLDSQTIQVGQVAHLTLFDAHREVVVGQNGSSLAANVPYKNQRLKGRIIGTVCAGNWKGVGA
jgi:dihydroorotase